MSKFLGAWWCELVHMKDWRITRYLKGNASHGDRLFWCPRCHRRYVMSDTHRAIFCYSDDPKLAKDLAFIYQIDIGVLYL